MADVVVGSGPAGIAVALARLARGREVVLLDGGRDLEPAQEARRRSFAADTDADAREGWTAPQYATPPGQVRRYGSDFAMEPAAATFAGGDPVALRASRAQGGLSSLWGAALLPWRPSDIADWPVPAESLNRSWADLARVVPVAGRSDALAGLFPGLPMGAATPLPPGPQIARVLRRFDARARQLARLGATAGQARVAVAESCRLCGLCLHGCPWGLIWSARHTLAELRRDPRVSHRPGATVVAVSQDDTGAVAQLEDGGTVRGERLFLAAGVLETARIWMASAGGPEEMVLHDSQFAFLPMLHPRAVSPPAADSGLHTLTQAFVELDDPAVGPRSVHAQVFGWNDFYARELRGSYGRLPFSGPLLDRLARHLVVAQVFLHSDLSARIALRRVADGRLLPTALPRAETPAAMNAALTQMAKAMRLGGLVPLRIAARQAEIGASFHVGASLPMRHTPGPGESDLLGRPGGGGRLHVVDASVLPAIPATTITFGVMGNAHRIGLETPIG